MINNTTLKVPKKYHDMIEDIYKDIDGYWINLKEEFYSTGTGTNTIHEYTQKDVLKELKTIVKGEWK